MQHLRDHGQKATKKKLKYLQNIFIKVFSPHYNDQDQEDKQDPAMPIQSQ